jgi:hypothetical protein
MNRSYIFNQTCQVPARRCAIGALASPAPVLLKNKKGAMQFLRPLPGAFSLAKTKRSPSFLPSLVAGASQQLLVFVFSHLFLAFLNNASHSITSVL